MSTGLSCCGWDSTWTAYRPVPLAPPRRRCTGPRSTRERPGPRSGAPPDGKRFVPHLTLARLKRPIEATKWLRVLDTYRSPRWHLDEIDLVASYLGEGPGRRPRYETAATIPLGHPEVQA
ncbi:MAG: 2'-5' RNA ligase family protein [Dermatophilaceae bacterium]